MTQEEIDNYESSELYRLFWIEFKEWSEATFGVDRGPIGPLKHLEKEAKEAYSEQDEAKRHEEIADCLFLVFDAARRDNMGFRSLIKQCFLKLEKNKKRTWVKPANPDEPVEHDRSGEAK